MPPTDAAYKILKLYFPPNYCVGLAEDELKSAESCGRTTWHHGLMVMCHRLMVVRHGLMVVCHGLTVVHHGLMVVRHRLTVVHHGLKVVCHRLMLVSLEP